MPETQQQDIPKRKTKPAGKKDARLPQATANKYAVNIPSMPANNRCPCSNRTAVSFHQPSGFRLPKLRGQSGTAMPAFQLVTKPPTLKTQNTNETTTAETFLRCFVFKKVTSRKTRRNNRSQPTPKSSRTIYPWNAESLLTPSKNLHKRPCPRRSTATSLHNVPPRRAVHKQSHTYPRAQDGTT